MSEIKVKNFTTEVTEDHRGIRSRRSLAWLSAVAPQTDSRFLRAWRLKMASPISFISFEAEEWA